MLHKNLGAYRSLSENNNREKGYILLIAVIIITAVISVILVKITLSALTGLNDSTVALQGKYAEFQTESCAQEALLRLNRDNSYVGGTFNLADGACAIVISGNGNNRTIVTTGNLNNYFHTLNISVTLSPFAIVTWDN